MDTINQRIEKLINTLGITKTAFADRLKVSQQYISKLIRKGNPSDLLLDDICQKFNINEEWLRTGNGPMFVELPPQQELMKHAATLLKDTDHTVAKAIKTFIITYEQLDDTSKAVLDEALNKYIENMKKSQ